MIWSPDSQPPALEELAIGFLDVDNLLVLEDRPFSHSAWAEEGMNRKWMEWVLDNALLVLRSIGRKIELRAFVDLASSHKNAARREIRQAAEERGITLIHVPAQEGKDQVDAALIANWNAARREMSPKVPFVLFSEDTGYAETLIATRKERGLYLFLPVNHFYPQHVKLVDGWGWIDRDAQRNRALSFLLNQDAPEPSRHFLEQFFGRSEEARRWWADGSCALDAIEDHPELSCETDTACVAFLVEHGIEAERAEILLWYLIRYEVFRFAAGHLRPNGGYLRRTFPLSSVA